MRAGRSLSRQKTNGNSPADHDGERPNADSLSKTLAASEVQQRPLVDLVRRPLATLPGGSLCICLSTCATFPTFLLPLLRRAFSQPTVAHFLAPPLYSSTSAHVLLSSPETFTASLLSSDSYTTRHHSIIEIRSRTNHKEQPRTLLQAQEHNIPQDKPRIPDCFFCFQSSPQDLDIVRKQQQLSTLHSRLRTPHIQVLHIILAFVCPTCIRRDLSPSLSDRRCTRILDYSGSQA